MRDIIVRIMMLVVFVAAASLPAAGQEAAAPQTGMVSPGATFQPEDWEEPEEVANPQSGAVDDRAPAEEEEESAESGREETEQLTPSAEEATSLRRMQGGARPEHAFLGFTPMAKRQKYRMGPFLVGPMLQVTETYTNNVFLNTRQKTDDWITVIHPSVSVTLPLGRGPAVRNKVGVFSSLRIIRAWRHEGNFNTELFNVGGYGEVEPLGNMTRKLKVAVSNVLNAEAKLPVSNDDREDKYWENHAAVRAGYDFTEKTKGEVIYDLTRRWYFDRENELDDFTEHGFTVQGSQSISEQVNVMAGGTYARHYQGQSDDRGTNTYRIFVGPDWAPTGNLRGRVIAGWEWQDYWELSYTANGPFAQGAVEWDPTERITVAGQVFSTIRSTERTDYNMAYGVSYEDRGGRIRPIWHVTQQWDVYVEGGYINSVFDSEGVSGKRRRDHLWMASVGTNYRVTSWLELGLAYMWQHRHSNYDQTNFEEHSVVLSGTVTF